MATALREVTKSRPKADRRALVVLGMHRSGTSAMTRMLALSGAGLPKRLMAAQQDNPSGFWEPRTIAALNDEILQALDSEWDDVFAFRPKQYLSNFDRFFLGRAVELLQEEFAGADLIVLKDPRISVLTSFWDRALEEAGFSTHYVVMVRNPLEVAESLRVRDEFPREKSFLLWSSYMIAIDRDTRERSRTFVSFDQLIDDWRAARDRIEADASVPFPRSTAAASLEIDRFLDSRQRHHRTAAQDLFSRHDIPEEVKTLYRIYMDACEGAKIDQAAVDAIQKELAKVDAMVGPLLADLRAKTQKLAKEMTDVCEASAAAHNREAALAEQLAAEREARQSDTADLNGRIEASEADRERLLREIADLAAQVASAEAERARLLVEIEEKGRQTEDMSRRVVASESDREALIRELSEQKSRTADLTGRLAAQEEQAQREREELTSRVEKADARSSELAEIYDREVATYKARVAELGARVAAEVSAAESMRLLAEAAEVRLRSSQSKLEEAQRKLEAQTFDLNSAKSDLEDRYRELAELGRAFVREEDVRQRHQQQGQWLRELHIALMNDKWWVGMMPRSWRQRRRLRQLARAGLFNAEAYLSNNPDVANSGQDPLRHYLVHGIDENREA